MSVVEINWAAEKSTRHLAEALKKGHRGAFRELSEDIALYLVAEANASLTLKHIDPWRLSYMSSLPLWEALIERGRNIN